MASFTDIIPQFNPYIKQLPVDAMVQVGMEKQKRYDEGIQKIQTSIDNVAGLDIMKDADKAYLQSKINELGNNLKTVAAGDFSNFQLVNSVSGMANQIMKDANVQNAVKSTAHHRKQVEIMDKARQEGKLTPDNENFYATSLNKYLSSSKPGEVFSSNYIPYYDIDKDVTEMMKAAHADASEWEEFARNPDGSVNADIMIEKAKKGLLSPKVRNIVDAVFSKPQVQQQLVISGVYNYRGYTPEGLLKTQEASLQALTDKAMKMREQYALLSSIDNEEAAKADQAIVAIDNQINTYREEYNRFVDKLSRDPEGAKVELYTQNLRERFVSNFSWEENSQKSKVSPQFDVGIRRATYELSVAKEKFDQWIQREQLDISRANLAIAQEDAVRKRLIAEGKLNPDGSAKVNYSLGGIDPAVAAGLGSSSFIETMNKVKSDMTQIGAELFTSLPEFKDLYLKRNGQFIPNTAKYGDGKQFEAKLGEALVALNNAHLKGTVNNNLKPLVQKYYDLTSLSIQQTQEQNRIEAAYKPMMDQFNRELGGVLGNKQNFTFNYYAPKEAFESAKPRTATISRQDIFDYYVWKNVDGDKGGNSAKNRIIQRHGEEIWEGLKGLLSGSGRAVRTGGDYELLSNSRKSIGKAFDKVPGLTAAMLDKENQYRAIQEQKQYYYGTSNTAKPEDKLSVNQIFAAQVSALTGEKGGEYKTLISWLDATKPENLNNNLYDHYRGSDGQWYIQIRRNTGEGKFAYSEALPVSYDVIQSLGGKVNPNQQAFDDVFGGFLDLNGWKSTTGNLKSKEAEGTAILRRPVGKYSVGYHLEKFGNGYVPYAYIRDKSGNILGNGIQIDFSVYSKDKSLSPQQRKGFENAQTIISMEDMLPKLYRIDEHFIDLLLQNR